MSNTLKIALAGNPNSGKTSLFNALTGLNQKVSNFPGTTVDRKTGFITFENKRTSTILDLPGTYSLYPKSEDEKITYDVLSSSRDKNHPDLVIFVADASNLKRNLLLFTQIADLKIPIIMALNMIDLAERKGITYDLEKLSERLGVPVVLVNGRSRKGVIQLKDLLNNPIRKAEKTFFNPSQYIKSILEEAKQKLELDNDYETLHHLHYYNQPSNTADDRIYLSGLIELHKFNSNRFQTTESVDRYRIIDDILKDVRIETTAVMKGSMSKKLDSILTHKFFGLSIFLLVMFLIFQGIFSLSQYPMEWVEEAFSYFSKLVHETLPPGMFNDLIVHGILAGLSGVIIFLPQIIILFAFISILEDVGYMARVSFIMDKIMKQFGLNGKSIVPLISGMACAVPAIMSTRTISDWKQRLITILVIPLMSCSARLPVYVLLISFIAPSDRIWGVFNLQGMLLMIMYLVGFIAAMISALIFKWIIKAEGKNYFIMELPGYKFPVLSNIAITIYEQARNFVFGAGKVIIAVSIVLWVLASFGPENPPLKDQYHSTHETNVSRNETQKASQQLTSSYAGIFGKSIEPVIEPLGFDWKIGIALITSLAAREVFVGTMATIYSVESEQQDFDAIRKNMQEEINPKTGEPQYNRAVAFSLMFFYAFAMQCISTIAVVNRETRNWKWPLIQFTYMTILAYISSLLVFRLLS